MGGCTDCKSKGGCDSRKASQRELFADVIARVYPGRTWGQPDDEARFDAGVGRREVKRVGRLVAAELRAPTFFRAGEDEDLCDFLYVLCLGRRPALVELRASGGLARPADMLLDTPIEERYLRVAFSTVARMAAVEEVTMTMTPTAEALTLREVPRPGVFDGALLKRLQKLVALLEGESIHYLDFGLLAKPLDDSSSGDYVARYGVAPALANFLFYAQPPSTPEITVLAAALPG